MFFSALALAATAIPTFAQAAADNASTVDSSKAIAAGIGFGLAAGLAAIGQGIVGSKAAEGAARNPGAAGTGADIDDYCAGSDRVASSCLRC